MLAARPMRLPTVAAGQQCPASPKVDMKFSPVLTKLGTYGFGPGPAYLSGQFDWHSGETAILYVEPAYNRLLTQGYRLTPRTMMARLSRRLLAPR